MAGTEPLREEIRETISAPRVTCSRITAASVRSSFPGFCEDGVRHPNLSDVVEESRGRERTELSCREAQLAADGQRDRADALGVTCRVRVAGLDCGVQRLDRLKEGGLERARGLDQVVRALGEVFVLRVHPCGGAAHQQRQREPEQPEDEPDRVPDRAARVVDEPLDHGVVESDLRDGDDPSRRRVQRRPP